MPPIFCELDDILLDFEYGVECIFRRKSHVILPGILWSRLASTPNFFTYLPWRKDGERLWDAIWPFQPTILSGITGLWAEPQKSDWITRELGPDTNYITCLPKHKHIYCPSDTIGGILIDNKETLRQQWQEAGGIFIHHVNTEKTIRQLEEILGIPLEVSNTTYRC